MRFTTTVLSSSSNRSAGLPAAKGWGLLAAVVMAAGGVGCGGEQGLQAPEMTARASTSLTTTNGIITNGIITNGIITNGIITNGLTTLSLGSSDFQSWFNTSPDERATLMSYLARCAVPSGQSLSFTNPSTGVSYTWNGALGLAPDWAAGNPATVAEQQVVTGCLAAHVNKFGVHVTLSLLGQDAHGTPITASADELATYSEREGCFFGNGFDTAQGFFVGDDHGTLADDVSSARACAMGWASGSADCSPLVHVGSCSAYCTKDATGTYYTSCTYNGVTYLPFTTRIRPADLNYCGDGVCQVGESCGTGTTHDNCGVDCGPCP